MLKFDGLDGVKPGKSQARKHRGTSSGALLSIPAAARLADVEIRRLFSPWETARGIVFGVSGGPDSVALMLLAADWARACSASPPLYVATIDHGLREDSGREAEMVGRWARELGLPHAILVWEGVKPRSGIQERAREIRYRLLFQHAARIGADHVMTAHHADDQAETILFRLLRGSGMSGLSGMNTQCERNGLVLARPLLGHSKADLVAICEAKAHDFIADPSNDDPDYARTRMRKLGALLGKEGFDRDALLRLGRRAARAEAALAARARVLRAHLAARRESGSFTADLTALANEPEEISLRILGAEIELAGSGRPLRLERLEVLAGKIGQALRQSTGFKATLGGTVLQLKSNGTLIIVKEGGRRRGHENPSRVS
ncbi:MAG: tRNA lysidine(34) synthetase TilS [Beijerinckiaceae bacterium]|nr:tRNA lysidine(34) synthetase TilS [Beijerinckiaceae bacterium]